MTRVARALSVYLLVSILPVLALGVLLVGNIRHSAHERVIGRGAAEAGIVQSMGLATTLAGTDLGDLTTADFTRLTQATRLAVANGAVHSITLRGLDGAVLFAGGSSTVPPTAASSASFRTARGATAVRLVADPDAPSGLEIRVLQPLIADNYGRSNGVLELGLPYEDIAHAVQVQRRREYVTLGIGLLLLCLTQGGLAWWTTRRLRRSVAENRHQALHDELTGLPNRRLFQQRAAETAAQAAAGLPAAVVLVDLDHFKQVNDTLGHAAGDELLCETARRLERGLRPQDVVARLGGDEFGVILSGVGTAQRAREILDGLQAKLAEEYLLRGVPLSVEASFGVALTSEGSEKLAVLLQRADIAMYDAKRSGGGVVVAGGQVSDHSSERLALHGELRRALEEGELLLYYQPQVDMASGRVVALEALVRWQHPHRGLLEPGQFLDIVEQSGLVGPFTSWVMNRAFADCAHWSAAGADWDLAVNISVRNLTAEGFPAEVTELLTAHGVPPQRLTLEITETSLAADDASFATGVRLLHETGVDVSIDDFGTGFTTFAMTRLIDVGELKIDRGFVAGILTRHEDRAIVSAVLEFARGVGCRVVAEGVESDAVHRWLAERGCDRGQGFHYSPPMPWRELSERMLLQAKSIHLG